MILMMKYETYPTLNLINYSICLHGHFRLSKVCWYETSCWNMMRYCMMSDYNQYIYIYIYIFMRVWDPIKECTSNGRKLLSQTQPPKLTLVLLDNHALFRFICFYCSNQIIFFCWGDNLHFLACGLWYDNFFSLFIWWILWGIFFMIQRKCSLIHKEQKKKKCSIP